MRSQIGQSVAVKVTGDRQASKGSGERGIPCINDIVVVSVQEPVGAVEEADFICCCRGPREVAGEWNTVSSEGDSTYSEACWLSHNRVCDAIVRRVQQPAVGSTEQSVGTQTVIAVGGLIRRKLSGEDEVRIDSDVEHQIAVGLIDIVGIERPVLVGIDKDAALPECGGFRSGIDSEACVKGTARYSIPGQNVDTVVFAVQLVVGRINQVVPNGQRVTVVWQ